MRISLFLFLLIGIISCQNGDDGRQDLIPQIQEEYAGVSEEFWPYFDSFQQEALFRGLNINLKEIGTTALFVDIDEPHIAGICTRGNSQNNEIEIDSKIWKNATDLLREFIVFHELGHCVLEREHDDSKDSHGVCLSIMRSGNGVCTDNYSESTRSAYLNELFQE